MKKAIFMLSTIKNAYKFIRHKESYFIKDINNYMFDIALSLLAAFISGAGVFLQKKGLVGVKKIKGLLSSIKWMSGTFLLLVSFLIYLLALKVGRLLIVQPLLNMSALFLFLLEVAFLKEKIKINEILALALFLMGLIMMQV